MSELSESGAEAPRSGGGAEPRSGGAEPELRGAGAPDGDSGNSRSLGQLRPELDHCDQNRTIATRTARSADNCHGT